MLIYVKVFLFLISLLLTNELMLKTECGIMIVSLRLGLLLDIVNWCVLPYYLMYHCNYEHTGLKCKVLLFTALFFYIL